MIRFDTLLIKYRNAITTLRLSSCTGTHFALAQTAENVHLTALNKAMA